jgi:hypothetical protein
LKRALAAVTAVVATSVVATPALATDFYLEGQATGGGSTWRSDGNGQGDLRAGFQFARIIGVEAQGRLGYANVDERMLMGLGLGARLALPIEPFTPHLRLGMIHFHEEPLAAAHHDPFGALVGVGDGIRHRFGVEAALGLDWKFARVKKTSFFASVESYVHVFPDHKGPLVYGGGGLGMGLRYAL